MIITEIHMVYRCMDRSLSRQLFRVEKRAENEVVFGIFFDGA